MICPSYAHWEPEPTMATFTATPNWTAMRCVSLECRGGFKKQPWRGPLGKCVKDAQDYARCPYCLKPVEKVLPPTGVESK